MGSRRSTYDRGVDRQKTHHGYSCEYALIYVPMKQFTCNRRKQGIIKREVLPRPPVALEESRHCEKRTADILQLRQDTVRHYSSRNRENNLPPHN